MQPRDEARPVLTSRTQLTSAARAALATMRGRVPGSDSGEGEATHALARPFPPAAGQPAPLGGFSCDLARDDGGTLAPQAAPALFRRTAGPHGVECRDRR